MSRGEKTKMLWKDPKYRANFIAKMKTRPKMSRETRELLSKVAIRNGLGRGNKGRKLTKKEIEHRTKVYIANGKAVGGNHYKWKGEDAGYQAKHTWVRKNYGEIRECEDCLTKTAITYDWANISGKYIRKRNDWKRLCRKCHRKFDKGEK